MSQTVSKRTPKDIMWDKAVASSHIDDVYNDFSRDLQVRKKTNTNPNAHLFDEEDYEKMNPVAKAERKLYSLYAGRDIQKLSDLTPAETQDINARLKAHFITRDPVAYIAVEHAKSILDSGYKADEVENGTTLDNLADALQVKLKEHKIAGNHSEIASTLQQNIVQYLPEAEHILFKTNLESIDFEALKKPDTPNLLTQIIANSHFQKSPETLDAFYEGLVVTAEQPKQKTHINFSSNSQNQNQSEKKAFAISDKTQSMVTNVTMGLIATNALASLFSDGEKTTQKDSETQEPSKTKLAFRKVISVAATVGVLATAGLWAYRVSQNNGRDLSQSNTANVPVQR